MLTLYHNSQMIVLDTTEYYIRELASGMDELIFDLSIWDPAYAMMAEEENISAENGQRYLIKQIDAGAVTAKIVCQLDLDEWRATLSVGYDSGSKTVAQQIDAVKPAGWTVSDFSGSSISRTLHGDYTPLQVCEACRDVYNVYIRWDNNLKVVKIYTQTMGSPVGAFATRELNLKEINYKGKSTNFATRLYAYGKDGLSFASINSGKPYVDDNTYSNRVICAYWQDERYTDKQSLLDDARKHLAKLAVPERSYDCAIVDLQATNPDLYSNLDFSLFTAATLIDDVKGTSVDYQVIERHVWPHHPDRNDVIFNDAPVKIQNAVVQIQDELTDPDSTFQQILQSEISAMTDWLLNRDSHLYLERNADGSIKAFIFVCGDEPLATATRVMRIDASGIGFSKTGVNGPYVAGFAFDFVNDLGAHLNADFITVGTMVANRIRGGLLQSMDSVSDPNFNLDMDNGNLTAKALEIITETLKWSSANGYILSEENVGFTEYPIWYRTLVQQGRLVCSYDYSYPGAQSHFKSLGIEEGALIFSEGTDEQSASQIARVEMATKNGNYIGLRLFGSDVVVDGDLVLNGGVRPSYYSNDTGQTTSVTINGTTLNFVNGILTSVS
jgi:hypothetical protein